MAMKEYQLAEIVSLRYKFEEISQKMSKDLDEIINQLNVHELPTKIVMDSYVMNSEELISICSRLSALLENPYNVNLTTIYDSPALLSLVDTELICETEEKPYPDSHAIMKKVKCANGHFFDMERFQTCPICGADVPEDIKNHYR